MLQLLDINAFRINQQDIAKKKASAEKSCCTSFLFVTRLTQAH